MVSIPRAKFEAFVDLAAVMQETINVVMDCKQDVDNLVDKLHAQIKVLDGMFDIVAAKHTGLSDAKPV